MSYRPSQILSKKVNTLINKEENIKLLHLSDEMKKFLALLNRYPAIERYWKIENSSYVVNLEQIKKDIALFSHGEQVLIKFFVSLFTGQQQPELEFDMFEAAQVLSPHHLDMVISWLKAPFWP